MEEWGTIITTKKLPFFHVMWQRLDKKVPGIGGYGLGFWQ